jgi:hypothetical protein
MVLCCLGNPEIVVKNPVAETTGRLKIEYLFSVSFPLVGNPSDLFGIARKIPDKPE